jgi:hypothetical protein
MARITKNLVVTFALMGASQRMAAAQPTSAEESTGKLEQAQSQAQQGLLVEARATLARILSTSPKASDPPDASITRAKAQQLDGALQERLGSLRFEVTGLSPGVLATVWVDENVNPVVPETPLKVNPGRHIVVAKTATQQVSQTVDVRERATAPVVLAFAPSAVPTTDVGGEQAPGVPPVTRPGLPAAAYWGLGVGAAGFMVGSVTGILALVSKKPNDPRCAASQCPPSSWNDYDPTQKTLARASTASLLIGAAGVGLALGSILMNKKHEAAGVTTPRSVAQSVRIAPAPGGMGLSGKW